MIFRAMPSWLLTIVSVPIALWDAHVRRRQERIANCDHCRGHGYYMGQQCRWCS